MGGPRPRSRAEILPRDRALRVYTNTLSIAITLMDAPLLTVYTLGGRVRPVIYAEVSLDRGLTTHDAAEAAIKRLMHASARRRILLADHSEFGKVSNCKHADLADIDLLITDTGINPQMLTSLRSTGLQVESV